MAKIKSPVQGYTGVVVGVQFTNGEAETDRESALAYFTRQGYTVEEAAAPTGNDNAGKGSPSKDELKARAKELGLPLSGSKSDLEKRIAEHEAKGQEPPHDPPAAPTGNEDTPDPDSTPPASGDGAGSVREV